MSMTQLKPEPAPTAGPSKVPVGTFSWPEELSPQHLIVPLVRMPQVWLSPELMAVNVPLGGLDSPEPLPPSRPPCRPS